MTEYEEKYDLNKDDVIDDADYAIFQKHFGEVVIPYGAQTIVPLTPYQVEAQACDFNGDGIVNISDYGMFTLHFGARRSEPTPIPPTPPGPIPTPGPAPTLAGFLPTPFWAGPPLPLNLGIYWPWYKGRLA